MQSGKKPTPSPEQIPTPGGVTWGVGPAIQWPTGTDPLIDSGKWVAGPTAVILEQQSGWTYGVLANHVWSFADAGGPNDQPDVNQDLHTALPPPIRGGLNDPHPKH